MSTPAASSAIINGVRVAMVARLVSGVPDIMSTPDERRIALHVQRVGEKLERKGYLPSLRRSRMLAVIVEEAKLVRNASACAAPVRLSQHDGGVGSGVQPEHLAEPAPQNEG